jgi:hypothetical protein
MLYKDLNVIKNVIEKLIYLESNKLSSMSKRLAEQKSSLDTALNDVENAWAEFVTPTSQGGDVVDLVDVTEVGINLFEDKRTK